MPKRKKSDPELLLVSFCDIVTVTTSALFMALIIVVDAAGRTPVLRKTPISRPTTNMPVYVECRENQVFPIDRTNFVHLIQISFTNTMAKSTNTTESLSHLMTGDVGDEYYKVDSRFLLMGQFALIPRTNAEGVTDQDLKQPANKFTKFIEQTSKNTQYLVFLVRDDSFQVFRDARDVAVKLGYESGWEYLGRDEPLTFAGTYARIRAQ